MQWLEKREQLDSTLPEAWNLLCIAIEQTIERFEWTTFAKEGKFSANAKRINTCIHVSIGPKDGTASQSIDVCLDKRNRLAVSRDGGRELAHVKFGHGPDGKACPVDDDGKPMTNDRASEIFLRTFLFGEAIAR
jgi:hypothetical protein